MRERLKNVTLSRVVNSLVVAVFVMLCLHFLNAAFSFVITGWTGHAFFVGVFLYLLWSVAEAPPSEG